VNDLRTVKNKTTTIDNGFALIKQSVLKVKDMANGLASESTYLQLKNISD
jgi:hypothetical protein